MFKALVTFKNFADLAKICQVKELPSKQRQSKIYYVVDFPQSNVWLQIFIGYCIYFVIQEKIFCKMEDFIYHV